MAQQVPLFLNWLTNQPIAIDTSMLTGSPVNVFSYFTPAQVNDVKSNIGSLDTSSSINSALTAMGTGTLYFPPGVYGISNPIIINTGQYLLGAGRGPTTIRVIAGPRCVMLQTTNFATLFGTNTVGGPYQWGVSNILFDGNRTNTTGGAQDVFDIYGYDFLLRDVDIWNASGNGIFSQWSTSTATPVASGGAGMESHIFNVKVYNSSGNGIQWQGPHDTMFNQVLAFDCVGASSIGISLQDSGTYLAAGTILNNCHVYGCHSGIYINAADIQGTTIISESNNNAGIFVDTGGNLIASQVYTFDCGIGGSNDGTTLAGNGSQITNLRTLANTRNGVTVGGSHNIICDVYATGNAGIGVVLNNGVGATLIGATSFGNTTANYALNAGNNAIGNF